MNLQQVELYIAGISIPGKIPQMVASTNILYYYFYFLKNLYQMVLPWKSVKLFQQFTENVQKDSLKSALLS